MSDRPAPRRPWLVLVLLTSMAINALTIGMLIGSDFAAPALRTEVPTGSAAVGGFAGGLSQLPLAERRRFQAAMRPYRPDIRASRLALGEARGRLAAVIARPEFDAASVTAAFSDVRSHATALQARVQEATAVALGTLSPQSRRVLAGAVPRLN